MNDYERAKMYRDQLKALNAISPSKRTAARKIIDWTVGLLAGGILMTLFMWGFLNAAVKEDEARDAVRAQRCAAYGENLPKKLEPYCAGLQ